MPEQAAFLAVCSGFDRSDQAVTIRAGCRGDVLAHHDFSRPYVKEGPLLMQGVVRFWEKLTVCTVSQLLSYI